MSNLKKMKQPLSLLMAVFLLFGLYPLEPVLILSGEPQSYPVEETTEIYEADVDLLEEVEKIEEELEESESETELLENETYTSYPNEDEEHDDEEIDRSIVGTLEELLPPSIYKTSDKLKGETISSGQYISYTITVVNPNGVTLYDLLVVDNLAGGGLVNPRNVSVMPDNIGFTYNINAGELHVNIDFIPANGFADIRFEARVADGVEAGELVNTARLYRLENGVGCPPIDEDNETVIVVRPEICPPCPSCPPEEECLTYPSTTPSSSGTPSSTIPSESSTPGQPGVQGPPGSPLLDELITQPSAPISPDQLNMPLSDMTASNELNKGVTTLPQTGVAVGSLFLSGLLLVGSGFAVASKKKKSK